MKNLLYRAFIVGVVIVVLGADAFAGGGHIHGYSGGEESSDEKIILLGHDAISNLAIQTAPAKSGAPLALKLSGVVQRLPEGVVAVSAPSGGTLTKLVAPSGRAVKRGETVALFTPFQVGAGSFPLAAPIDGVVGSFSVALGVGVDVGDPIFTIFDPSRVGLVAPLTRGIESGRFGAGNSVSVSVKGDAAPFEGRIYLVESGGADLGVVGRIIVELIPRNGDLPPLGAVGSIAVEERTGDPVFRLPREAVVGSVVDPVVFVRRGNRFERRSVVVTRYIGDSAEIVRGLAAGEDIVVQGGYQLQRARSDRRERLTVGPHGGVIARCKSEDEKPIYAEIKLHDDKGDIELWLAQSADFKTSLLLPVATRLSLTFREHPKTIALAVRDEKSNKDEDGVSHLKDGGTDYFVFPGETGADAAWLQGGEFIDEAALSIEGAALGVSCPVITVVPHTHGAGGHSHEGGDPHDAEAHDHHGDHAHGHGHDHDEHDHGGGHSH
ncbi:MAG: hypothetical protein RL417_2402 [Pseudomonadota bacterium]|jgi:biotin carboxyl carrier protein